MTKETLYINNPVDFQELATKHLQISENNEVVGETEFGQWKEQIIPSIYFRQNEFFRADFNSAMNGLSLKIISTEKNISFNMEILDNLFLDYYDILQNKFSLLKSIKRSDIIKYEKIGNVKFMGVKAKNSYKIMKGLRGAPVGGLITGMLVRGAFKLAAKAEDDLIQKDGVQFALYFLDRGVTKKIDIIVESFYVSNFTNFLNSNWNKVSPPRLQFEEEKSGCFVATACYNDYDHHVVLQLRYFRDNFLSKRNWGKNFIQLYYRWSPRYASYISNNNYLKILVKTIIIKPLYYVSKLF